MPRRETERRHGAYGAVLLLAIAGAAAASAQPPEWRPVGPWGGRVILGSDRAGERLWATTASGHLHESQDGGRTWHWLGPACGARGPCFSWPSPHDDQLWFASGLNGELLRSPDHGATWQDLELAPGTPVPPNSVTSMAFSPTEPAKVYLLGQDGRLWASADRGVTFSYVLRLDSAAGSAAYLLEVPDTPESFLLVTKKLELCQLNTGQCTTLLPETEHSGMAVGVFGGGGGVWVALGRTILFAPSVGAAWQDASAGMEAVVSGYPEPVRSFAFDGDKRAVYAMTTAGVLRWDLNSGGPWRFVLQQEEILPISGGPCGWLLREGGHLIACNPRGPVLCRDDETTCEVRQHGLAGLPVRAFLLDPDTGEPYIAATLAGVYARAAGEPSWTRTLDYRSPFGAALAHTGPHSSDVWLASSWSVQRSHDAGQSWVALPPTVSHIEEFPPSLAVADRDGATLLLAIASELWRSTDGGERWSKLPQQVEMLAVNPRRPEEVWSALQGHLQRSLDGGASWENVASPASWESVASAACPPTWCFYSVVTAMAVNPFVPTQVVYGTAGMGLWSYHPQDGTKRLDTGLPLISAITYDPDRPGRLLVAGARYWGDQLGGRVLLSEDGGTTWRPLGNSWPLPDVRDLRVSFRHGRIAVATGNGIFVLDDTPRDNRPLRRGGPGRR